MKQGVLTNGRVRLLLKKGHSCYRERRAGEKQRYKAPKIQRLVTPAMLQRKRHRLALKRRRCEKNRQAAAEYAKILAQRQKEAKEAKEQRRKRSASLRESRNSVKST